MAICHSNFSSRMKFHLATRNEISLQSPIAAPSGSFSAFKLRQLIPRQSQSMTVWPEKQSPDLAVKCLSPQMGSSSISTIAPFYFLLDQ